MNKIILWLPPSFRFIVEFTTWIWLLVYNWYLLPISLMSLAFLNYPGDKRPADVKSPGFVVPGFVRILVEIGSAILGIWAAYHLFGTLGLKVQFTLSLISFLLDLDRWLWMVGFKRVPEYVTMVHKTNY